MKKTKENKASSSNKKSKKNREPPPRPSILNIMKDRSDCNCEVVAKAVRSNVHMNLGLADKRAEMAKDKHKD